jgi:tetratricopeptide (TPR) repeat protein
VIAERMRAHFEPMPAMELEKVERLEDLTPAIELYVSLIRLGRFDEALEVFRRRLGSATLYLLGASRQRVELLEMLFPEGVNQPPRLRRPRDQSYALNAIGLGLDHCGQPGRAARCFHRAAAGDERDNDTKNLAIDHFNLSSALLATGRLHAAEVSASRALKLMRAEPDTFRVDATLSVVGWVRMTRGALSDVRRLGIADQHLAIASGLLAQCALWCGEAADACQLADRACELAGSNRIEQNFIRVARLQGESNLAVGDHDRADERLHHALTRARAVNLVEEELPALTALATLYLRRGDVARAREHLDAIWDAAERGPYLLLHADARNVLTEIEIADKNIPAAIAAATVAYRLAWCDGPPFAYDYGLRTARAHLRALGAPEPEMPPYDASRHEPIEEVGIKSDE